MANRMANQFWKVGRVYNPAAKCRITGDRLFGRIAYILKRKGVKTVYQTSVTIKGAPYKP